MINYIRTHQVTAEKIRNADKVLWLDDTYLKPVIVDEWLMFGNFSTNKKLNILSIFSKT